MADASHKSTMNRTGADLQGEPPQAPPVRPDGDPPITRPTRPEHAARG